MTNQIEINYDQRNKILNVGLRNLNIDLTIDEARSLSKQLLRVLNNAAYSSIMKKLEDNPINLDCSGGKRCYPSEAAAKRGNTHARFRIRTYYCASCDAWHVTNADKRNNKLATGQRDRNKDY